MPGLRLELSPRLQAPRPIGLGYIASGLVNNTVLEQNNNRWAIKGTTTKTRVDLDPVVEVTDGAKEREERTTERTIERFTPVIQGWDLTPGETFAQHLIIDCEAPPPKPESKAG